jgi:hypothetical protein
MQHLCTRINVVLNIQTHLYEFQEAPNSFIYSNMINFYFLSTCSGYGFVSKQWWSNPLMQSVLF